MKHDKHDRRDLDRRKWFLIAFGQRRVTHAPPGVCRVNLNKVIDL